MKNLIYLILVVSVFSCQERYLDWSGIIQITQNGGKVNDKIDLFESKTTYQIAQVFLNSSDSLKIDSLSNDAIIEYLNIKKLLSNEKYKDVWDACNLFPSTQNLNSDDKFFLLFNVGIAKGEALKELGKGEAFKKHIDYLQNSCRKKNEYYVYCIAHIALLEANYYFNIDNYLESLSALHYGLNILSNSKGRYPLLEQEMLSKKASILIDRTEDDEVEAEAILDKLLSQAINLDIYTSALSNLIFACWRLKKFNKADSLISVGISRYNQFNVSQKNYFGISTSNYYMRNGAFQEAISFLDSYPFQYSKECEKNKYVSKLYMIDALIEKQEVEKATELLELIKVPNFCNERTKEIIEFYKGYTNINIASREKDFQKELSNLITHRVLANKLYNKDFDLHLYNYYAKNLESIFKNIRNQFENKVPKPYWNVLLKLYFNSRNRQLNVSTQKDMLYAITNHSKIDSLTSIIQKGLSESNDFTKLDDYRKSYYIDIYFAVKKFNEIKTLEYEKMNLRSSILLDMDKLEKIIKSRGQTLLCILEGVENYWFLTFNGEQMHLNQINIKDVDIMFEKISNDIPNQRFTYKNNFEDITKHLDVTSNNLLVIPDGKFSYIPFDLNGMNYTTSNSVNSIIDSSQVLNATKSMLMSFSDSATRRSLIKQEIGELYNDYEECSDIKQILGGQCDLYHGIESNFENLSKSREMDLLHISSHGVSDINNRLRSHIYLRKESIPVKVYINELYELKKTPKFVCLSLCDSGIGKHMLGVGTYSISRPFLENGTKTVLKTLWKIDDEGSKMFFSKFYNNWLNHISVSEALFKTKKEMRQIEKYKSPYYWAGYVLEGNGNLYLE